MDPSRNRAAALAVRIAVLAAASYVAAGSAPAAAATAAPVVAGVAVTGNAHVTSERILNVVGTKAGDRFDAALVEQDVRAIAALGFFASEAPPTVVNRAGGVLVTFHVREYPVVTSIRVAGNAHVGAPALLALMDTAPGEVFNTRTYQSDALKIDSYYDAQGFGNQVPTHVAAMDISPDGVLSLTIREGLTVRAITVAGAPSADPVLPVSDLRRSLGGAVGTVYSDTERKRDLSALEALYAKHGIKLSAVDAGFDPASVDAQAGTGLLRYAIHVVRVGAVEIAGNTKTHDDVIRRELRLRPGMVVTDAALERDRERIRNLGFFSDVELTGQPGPDPARPSYVTLAWRVKEQKTSTFMLGGGYSGGVTGTGLTANVSLEQNNLNGTGNSAAVVLQSGAQLTDAKLSLGIRHLGASERAQKYSLSASLFSRRQFNADPLYAAGSSTSATGTAVSLVPATTGASAISGVTSLYRTWSSGANATLGRALSDVTTLSAGVGAERVAASADLPAGYYFSGTQAVNPLSTTVSISDPNSPSAAIGVSAPSIAQILSSRSYAIQSLTFGLASDTRDSVLSPRRGGRLSLSDEVSAPAFGSDFRYQAISLDATRFTTVARGATLALHAAAGFTTGAVPTSKLFLLSDQQLRGYGDPYYGTDMLLAQGELRIFLDPARSFALVPFVDAGATRIRGGTAVSSSGSLVDLNPYAVHADAGLGLRLSIPQLGAKSIRIDFAKGAKGTHTSLGFGESF